MDQFYREIDHACQAHRLRYSAPKPLEHYYNQERTTRFRGIMVYTFPNRRIPEVVQVYNRDYGQYTGIVINYLTGTDLFRFDANRACSINKNGVNFVQFENEYFTGQLKLDANNRPVMIWRVEHRKNRVSQMIDIDNGVPTQIIKKNDAEKKPIKPGKL